MWICQIFLDAFTLDYDRAIADINQAIKLNPSLANAYDTRCEAYVKKGDYDHAITDCNQAIKLDSTHTNSYYSRGIAYKNKGSRNQAVEDFKKVLELKNDVELSQNAKQQLQELGTK